MNIWRQPIWKKAYAVLSRKAEDTNAPTEGTTSDAPPAKPEIPENLKGESNLLIDDKQNVRMLYCTVGEMELDVLWGYENKPPYRVFSEDEIDAMQDDEEYKNELVTIAMGDIDDSGPEREDYPHIYGER